MALTLRLVSWKTILWGWASCASPPPLLTTMFSSSGSVDHVANMSDSHPANGANTKICNKKPCVLKSKNPFLFLTGTRCKMCCCPRSSSRMTSSLVESSLRSRSSPGRMPRGKAFIWNRLVWFFAYWSMMVWCHNLLLFSRAFCQLSMPLYEFELCCPPIPPLHWKYVYMYTDEFV